MLRHLRKKKTMKRILWVLAILIVPAFVLWGAGSATRSKPRGPSYVGKIYGKKITFKKFAKSYEVCLHQLILSSGGDPQLLKQIKNSININRMAWERLIMLEEAKREHINVTDKEIIETIASNPIFKRKGGFDKELYNHILRYNLQTAPRNFEEETRENIALNKLRDKISKDAAVTEEELLEKYERENEKVEISFILIDPEDFKKGIQPNTEELKQFYEKREGSLRKGEEVSIRYLYIKADDMNLLSKITDEFKENKTFEDIAKRNSLEIEKTGFFGRNEEIPNIGWSYELTKAAFSLEKDMTSLPIYTPKGYYIINIKEKRSGYIPSFEEIESTLNKKLIEAKSIVLAEASASKVYEEIKESIEQGFSFEDTAEKLNLKIKRSEFFSRQDYIEGLGQAELVKEVAFSLEKGEINPPVRCEKGFAILRVGDLVPADKKIFEEEKEKLKEKLLAKKRLSILKNWFEEISKNAELEIDLELLPQ